ncbi:MAG: TRAP transporter small permease subunit [Oscillospiraceae bacterium]|nr:TRAP transporter small permease subunit [Oscillospiraceae bacterium]
MNENVNGGETTEIKSPPQDGSPPSEKREKKPKPKKAPPVIPEGDDFSAFLRVDKIIRNILRFFCYLSAIALIAIMLICVINVCGEKLQGAGVSWAKGIPNSNYLVQYLHIPLVFLAAGYVTLDQGHTRIDLLIQKFPKVERVAMYVGHVLGAFLGFFICYRGVTVTLVKDFTKNMRIASTATSPKEWPFTICHCVGFFLLGCSFVWALVRMIRFRKYPGVNPSVYLYPGSNAAPGEEADEPAAEEGGAES